LLVTRVHPFLQLPILAGALSVQLQRFTRCCFLLPSRPCLRPQPLPSSALLYLQPLSLLFSTCFTKLYALRFRARTRWSAKGHTAQTGVVEHFWPQAHSWAKPQPTQTVCGSLKTRCRFPMFSSKMTPKQGPWFGGLNPVATQLATARGGAPVRASRFAGLSEDAVTVGTLVGA
jgi:hypothetical protein